MRLLLLIILFLVHLNVVGQAPQQFFSSIPTQAAFLNICPDAYTNGMGLAGVTNTDFQQVGGFYHNPALLSSKKRVMLFDISYVPWLRKLVPDINFFRLGVVKYFGFRHVLGFDYTRISWGDITYVITPGNTRTSKFHDQCFAIRYAYDVSPRLSLGIAPKYIRSRKYDGFIGVVTGEALAADLGVNYRSEHSYNVFNLFYYSFGASILNIGKIRYGTTQKQFIPTTLKLGAMVSRRFNVHYDSSYFAIDVIYEAEKMLVPSPPIYARDSLGNIILDSNGQQVIIAGRDPNVNLWEGMFGSFADAPGDAKEEWAEIIHKFGVEVRKVFSPTSYCALRGGYYNEHIWKGGRKFFTLGLGGGFKASQLNIALYLPQYERSPLENTLVFSATYKQLLFNPDKVHYDVY